MGPDGAAAALLLLLARVLGSLFQIVHKTNINLGEAGYIFDISCAAAMTINKLCERRTYTSILE